VVVVRIAQVIPRPQPVEAGFLGRQRGGAHVGPASTHRNQEQVRLHDALVRREYHSSMAERILIGTSSGLWTLQGDNVVADEALAGRPVTALAREGTTLWAIVDGTALWERRESGWHQRATVPGQPATCLAPTANGLIVGTEQA